LSSINRHRCAIGGLRFLQAPGILESYAEVVMQNRIRRSTWLIEAAVLVLLAAATQARIVTT